MKGKHLVKKTVCLWMALCLSLTALVFAQAEDGNAALTALDGAVIATLSPSVPYGPEFLQELTGVQPGEILFMPTGNELLIAVMGGRADAAFSPREKARLDVLLNDSIARIPASDVQSQMVMLLRPGDEALLARMNEAITALSESGRAQALYKELVEEVQPDDLQKTVQIPERPGADTLYVGISGDMAPLDYIGPNGQPAGFNVAFMTEISEMLDMNVIFVPIATDAKFQALFSNRIDVFFWHGQNFLSPEGVATTLPYATMTGFDYVVKK